MHAVFLDEKVFQIHLEFSLNVVAETETPDPHKAFPVDRIYGREAGYLVPSLDLHPVIRENREIMIRAFQIPLVFELGQTPREDKEDLKPLAGMLILQSL